MNRTLIAFALAVSVAGAASSQGGEGRTRIFDFEGRAESGLPVGFQTGMTGSWKATTWRVCGQTTPAMSP